MAKQNSGSHIPFRRCAIAPLPRYAIFLYLCPVNKRKSMESTRQKKVSRLIQKELAEFFIRKSSEIAHGKLISVTMVRVSPDLSFAKAFLSIFPSSNQEEVISNIRDYVPRIRFELGQKIKTQLRIVPEIAFFIDDSLDYIDNIDKLLKK